MQTDHLPSSPMKTKSHEHPTAPPKCLTTVLYLHFSGSFSRTTRCLSDCFLLVFVLVTHYVCHKRVIERLTAPALFAGVSAGAAASTGAAAGSAGVAYEMSVKLKEADFE